MSLFSVTYPHGRMRRTEEGLIHVQAKHKLTVLGMIGLHQGNDKIIDTSFDILALEALFLIPRICSPLLSLNPYFGTLLPCLTAMTKVWQRIFPHVSITANDFEGLPKVSFTCGNLVLWIPVNVLPARQRPIHLSTNGTHPSQGFLWKLIPWFRYQRQNLSISRTAAYASIHNVSNVPLLLFMIILANCGLHHRLTQILLVTSLISILSNSLSLILSHAREEYLYVYSVFVLEASTSNRLTYFVPPLNLVSLALRPLRIFLSAEQLRYSRIVALKMTHLPHVLLINLYEKIQSVRKKNTTGFGLGSPRGIEKPPGWRRSVLNKRISSRHQLSAPSSRPDTGVDQSQVSPGSQPAAAAVTINDIKSVLDQLTLQIGQLKGVIEEQERQLQANDD
jgi:hypothetical protein